MSGSSWELAIPRQIFPLLLPVHDRWCLKANKDYSNGISMATKYSWNCRLFSRTTWNINYMDWKCKCNAAMMSNMNPNLILYVNSFSFSVCDHLTAVSQTGKSFNCRLVSGNTKPSYEIDDDNQQTSKIAHHLITLLCYLPCIIYAKLCILARCMW